MCSVFAVKYSADACASYFRILILLLCRYFVLQRPWPRKSAGSKQQDVGEVKQRFEGGVKQRSAVESVVSTLDLFRRYDVMLLFPTAFLCGYLEGFYFASYPTYMDDRVIIPTAFIMRKYCDVGR
jgi:hypothetical protein